MSIIPITDRNRLLLIKIDTHQSTSIVINKSWSQNVKWLSISIDFWSKSSFFLIFIIYWRIKSDQKLQFQDPFANYYYLFKGFWHVFEMCLHKKNHVILHGKRKCGLFPKAPWVPSCSNSQSPILVNCHDITPGIFDWWISHQTGMKSPSEYHNEPGLKFKDFLKI